MLNMFKDINRRLEHNSKEQRINFFFKKRPNNFKNLTEEKKNNLNEKTVDLLK